MSIHLKSLVNGKEKRIVSTTFKELQVVSSTTNEFTSYKGNNCITCSYQVVFQTAVHGFKQAFFLYTCFMKKNGFNMLPASLVYVSIPNSYS